MTHDAEGGTRKMPDDLESSTQQVHYHKVRIVQDAVASLLERFSPQGMTAAAICEGAIKGAAVVMLADRGASLNDVADLLADFAEALRHEGGADLVRH